MATAQQLKALIESYTEHNPERFLSVAAQIAAQAARTGKDRLAQELLKLIEQARKSVAATPPDGHVVPIAQPTGELSGLVSATFPKILLADMVLPPETRKRLERIVTEYRRADQLHSHGLAPRRKLLLLGPPGCGKSMTAAALAGELHLPLLTVQFHTLITKFMGETAAKLRLVFDAMMRSRGVYLFDEFDAIGAQRQGGHDVGEIRRVLNSFLIFLEQDQSGSLIVSASNLECALDSALFRRFDDVLRYGMPTREMTRHLITARLAAFDTSKLAWTAVLKVAAGMSPADIVKACEDAAKDAVLHERRRILSADLRRALLHRHRQVPPA